MAPNNIVLITGVTGFIGFRILQFALEAGWQVRAAVRSAEKADVIKQNPSIRALALSPSALSFVIVGNIERPGAFDDAVKGVTNIIHVASTVPGLNFTDPITTKAAQQEFIDPAVEGTLSLLEAARSQLSVRRIVITSSVTAIMPPAQWCGLELPAEGTVYSARSRVQPPPSPYPSRLYAYCVGKVTALNESEAWIAREGPHYSVVHIHPGLVFGRSDLFKTLDDVQSSTNFVVLLPALGAKLEVDAAGAAVHVDDVARLHLGALDEAKVKVDGTRSFLMAMTPRFDDIVDIVKEEYGLYVKSGVLKDDGSLPTNAISWDCGDTEEAFEFRFVSFRDQVRSVLDQYLELVQAQAP